MELFFCGTRGSTPAPGEAHVRYGGHTSCVALAHDGADPRLVLDAGTGLANLDQVLGEAPFEGTILLGHLHWDPLRGSRTISASRRIRPGALERGQVQRGTLAARLPGELLPGR